MLTRFRTRILLITAIVALALPAAFSFAGSVGAVTSRLMQASDYIDSGRMDDAKDKLDEAEKFLDGLTDNEKAPLLKQMANLRAKLGAPAPAPTPAPANTPANTPAPAPAPAPTNTPAPASADNEAAERISRNIDRNIKMAQEETNPSALQGMIENTQQALDNDDAKTNLSPDARRNFQSQIDALKAKVAEGDKAEAANRLADQIHRMIDGASAVENPDAIQDSLSHAHALLDSDDVKQKLDPSTFQKLTRELADTETQIHQRQKRDALSRAEPPLKELEDKVSTDPFKDVQPIQAYQVDEDLNALVDRVKAPLSSLPADDPDVKALAARLAAAQQKIDAADAAFASANMDVAIQNNWKFAMQDSDGWDSEQYTPGPQPFDLPGLPKTEKAASSAEYFLQQKETVDARQKGAALPKAAETIAAADKTLADAQARLDAAFNQWMDAAEKAPRPQGENRFSIGSAADMARWGDQVFAGSKYQSADVGRAKKLDQKWQDELAAIAQQHDAALKQMTADADAAWPKIADSISAEKGFHPADVAAAKGKTLRFNKVRNRSGWDFDGQYDLVIWVDGQPVAGMYEPAIKQAFATASKAIGDSVPDHVDWDVIAVIEGTGSANQRFTTTVKDEHMDVLGKVEGYRPVDCVVCRVIAIHAGPVAAAQ
jgi:hypothetical protein